MNDSDERRRLRMQYASAVESTAPPYMANQAPASGNMASDIQAPTSAIRSRLSGVRHRHHRRPERAAPSRGTATVQQAVERLTEASSNLSSLLDQPIPRTSSPDTSAREYSSEAAVNSRRSKRRKLNLDSSSTGHMGGFSYGYRGQVVPGPLKMQIVSCDGGIHTEAARNGREYLPDNVLRNDKSVYCTDTSKCNFILRHKGETAFCLKKLVIKAPERGFDAP